MTYDCPNDCLWAAIDPVAEQYNFCPLCGSRLDDDD